MENDEDFDEDLEAEIEAFLEDSEDLTKPIWEFELSNALQDNIHDVDILKVFIFQAKALSQHLKKITFFDAVF